ncbi:MAG TPA: hypothetical protein VHR47_08765 [Bacillota bacterium]|nr:hypothetical protein [Bacillota bacterium]
MEKTAEKGYLPLPALKSAIYVVAGKDEAEDIGEVVFLGDPDGLRSLGEILIAMADLDQTAISELPDNESEHIHLFAGQHIGKGDLNTHNLIVSRLDTKDGALKEFYKGGIPQERYVYEVRNKE